ncbi:MAG TPA: hypothetical protein VF897_22420 [Roseiflexaceae bacterium]
MLTSRLSEQYAWRDYTVDAEIPPLAPISACASVGCAAVPPAARVDSAPQAQASRSARPRSQPASQPYTNPASNESPAPDVEQVRAGLADHFQNFVELRVGWYQTHDGSPGNPARM